MKDALGGYFNLTLLMVFILLVSGFISLAINYTKAYRVKNNVLTYLEKYEGQVTNEEMLEGIEAYNESIGYKTSNSAITAATKEGYTCPKYKGKEQYWCYKTDRASKKYGETFNVDIVVFINMNIPIVNKAFSNVKFFWMNGTTNSIPVLN